VGQVSALMLLREVQAVRQFADALGGCLLAAPVFLTEWCAAQHHTLIGIAVLLQAAQRSSTRL
jgi:hypothetical protein